MGRRHVGVGELAIREDSSFDVPVRCDDIAEIGGVRADVRRLRVCPKRGLAAGALERGRRDFSESEGAASDV